MSVRTRHTISLRSTTKRIKTSGYIECLDHYENARRTCVRLMPALDRNGTGYSSRSPRMGFRMGRWLPCVESSGNAVLNRGLGCG